MNYDGSQNMKKENKLKKRKQFNWIFKNGTTIKERDVAIVYSSSYGNDYKVGFSVTKKVGKAVVRNKVKRRLKAIVSKLKNNIMPKHTMIFVAKPSIVDARFEDIQNQIALLLKKANLYKEI